MWNEINHPPPPPAWKAKQGRRAGRPWHDEHRHRDALRTARDLVATRVIEPDLSASARKVLIAHLVFARRRAKATYSASEREVAVLAGVSHVTAAKWGDLLAERGVLNVIARGRGPVAREWAISARWLAENVEVDRALVIAPVAQHLTHPAFRRGYGLNGLVWASLRPRRPLQIEDIVRRSGAHRSTVHRALHALHKESLAARHEDGWVRRGGTKKLDKVALASGAREALDRQIERYAKQRRAHRESYVHGLLASNHIGDHNDDIHDRCVAYLNTRSDWTFDRVMRGLRDAEQAKHLRHALDDLVADEQALLAAG